MLWLEHHLQEALEAADLDPRFGGFVDNDLAGYHFPPTPTSQISTPSCSTNTTPASTLWAAKESRDWHRRRRRGHRRRRPPPHRHPCAHLHIRIDESHLIGKDTLS
jgi:hypothetical protein